MPTARTTRCCSAIALTLAAWMSVLASAAPASFFPVRTVWTEPLISRPGAPPSFLERAGYVPTGDRHLIAYDLATGRLQWTADADVLSKPAAGDQLVFIAESDAISALRAADGSRAWRVTLDSTLSVPLVWDNGWLIAAMKDGSVLAFRSTDGRLIWRRDLGASLRAQPALAADRVYLPASDGRISALRIETGAPVWERRLGGPPHELLALDDRIYVGSDDNYFYSLAARDGTIAWRFPTGGDVIGLPFVDDRRVYFVSLDNMLRALDRRSGSQQWLRALPIRPTRGPVPVAEAILVSGSGPTVYGYLAKTGQPAGEFPAAGAVSASPYVVRDPLLVIVVADDVIKGGSISAIGSKPPDAAPAVARLVDWGFTRQGARTAVARRMAP